ncbi:MAG TPA: hypothetical protein VFX98_17195 [Longimicrobiaceae bacterium]|nr:hypothetical protein [Longimicrobiaceae bacterium]
MKNPLGFKAARNKVIRSLLAGRAYILFEPREVREEKNLLDTEEVKIEEVIQLLRRCVGTQFRCTPHHVSREIPVYVFQPTVARERWYIKAYFLEGGEALEPVIFISVHKQQLE